MVVDAGSTPAASIIYKALIYKAGCLQTRSSKGFEPFYRLIYISIRYPELSNKKP